MCLNFRKVLMSLIITFFIISIPMVSFSIVFKMKDEKGNYYYLCDGFSTEAIKIKIKDKNQFLAIGPYIGKIVRADNAFHAAQIVCGEKEEEKGSNK